MSGSARVRGFTLIELMVVIAVIAIIAAIAIPGLISSQRSSYERGASASMKTLSVAEADFRSNDRDGNKLNDFWTGDVKGLYTLTNAAVSGKAGGTVDPPIRLIELTVAGADTDGSTCPAGGENMDVPQFTVFSAKAGYWYSALTADNSLGSSPEATYKQDTGGTPAMGAVHNMSKYGFFAYPDSQTFGRFVYVVNEANTIYRSAMSTGVRTGTTTPPGVAGTGFVATYQNWPDEINIKSYWAKLD
jgi:prepilin-type N-terminal cleavage/methylation domain-containing protein